MAGRSRAGTGRLLAAMAIAVGLLAGSLITPVGAHFRNDPKHLGLHAWKQVIKQKADARYVRAGVLRSFSCPGSVFTPIRNDTAYIVGGELLHTTAGEGLFRCNAVLPDGARVERVSFSLRDLDDERSVFCILARISLDVEGGFSGEDTMASVDTGEAETPENVSISTTDISHATIDNDGYAYYLHCALAGSNDSLGLWGATVEYTM